MNSNINFEKVQITNQTENESNEKRDTNDDNENKKGNKKIKLSIYNSQRKFFTINCDFNIKVKELKKLVKKLFIIKERIQLMFDSRILEDDCSIEEEGLYDGCLIDYLTEFLSGASNIIINGLF